MAIELANHIYRDGEGVPVVLMNAYPVDHRMWDVCAKALADFADLNDVPDNYYTDNIYTARQFISCLKLLYDEQERFPGIIETLQQTEQERFFMLHEPRFKIAHKYGYVSENGHSFMNDCGLAFTSQPIALVMFTDNVENAEELLTAYCTAVCEYTNYTVANPPGTPSPEPTAEPTPTVPAVAASAGPAPTAAAQEAETARAATPLAALLFIALFIAAGVLGAVKLKKKYNADMKLTLLTVLLCTAGMLLAVAGCFGGTVIAKPTGDPQEAVTVFFDSLIAGDYTAAYDRVRDYTSLGLENEPSTESGKMVYAALHASYGYELTGSVRTDKLDAAQDVSFTYLSLPALEAAVAEETQVQLKHLVQQLPSSEVYDDNNNYLPEITEQLKKIDVDALNKVLTELPALMNTVSSLQSQVESITNWFNGLGSVFGR